MKRVLVTGGGSGIGLACVKRFAEAGYPVTAHYRENGEALFPLRERGVEAVRGDFSDEKGVEDFLGRLGDVDILVNNAASYHTADAFESLALGDVEALFRTNLYAPLRLCQAFYPAMRQRKWGRIVNVSSIGVKYGGNPASVHYTMSKAALETLTLSLGRAGAADNVLVNAVRAGVTDTRFHRHNPGKDMAGRVAMIPARRMAAAEEVAEAVFFLGSEQNGFVTGETLAVAGGE